MITVTSHGKDDLRVEDIPEPEPTPNEALVEVAYGGICGSDLHYWLDGAAGESIVRERLILGHEFVGTVVQQAADGSGPAAGTRVAVHPATSIDDPGVRWPRDRPNLAPKTTYLGSAAHFPHTNGGFADRVAIPAVMLRALPESVTLRQAAVVEPASVAFHALARLGDAVRPGATALVIGLGPIGALVVASLKKFGITDITGVDLRENPRRIAEQAGASRTLDAMDEDGIAGVQADIVFECSGSAPGLASAIRGAARGGRIALVGMLPTGLQPALLSLVIARELDLYGCFRFNDEIDDVIAALADGSLDASAVITHEYDAKDAPEAFRVAADASLSGKVLLRFAGAKAGEAKADAKAK